MQSTNHCFIRHLTRDFGCFVCPWAHLYRVDISQQSTGEALVEPLSSRLNGQYHAEKAYVFPWSADCRHHIAMLRINSRDLRAKLVQKRDLRKRLAGQLLSLVNVHGEFQDTFFSCNVSRDPHVSVGSQDLRFCENSQTPPMTFPSNAHRPYPIIPPHVRVGRAPQQL